jgi:hypothetical protein
MSPILVFIRRLTDPSVFWAEDEDEDEEEEVQEHNEKIQSEMQKLTGIFITILF